MGLGCGNPVALSSLREGETVLDLGSGGGIDCFLAAGRVGEKGKVIGGLDDEIENVTVFHAGTDIKNGEVVTSGGRVLGVTSLGSGIEKAIEQAYKAVDKINFERCFFRRDIGAKAFKWVSHRSQVTR